MTTPQDNNMDFMRQMWSNMGFGLPGMVTPTLDVDEIAKRTADLRAVEGWLKMNLSMLQMTIQGLEMQGAALSAVRAMSQPGENGEMPANPFANPALWTWPFSQAAESSPDAPPDNPPAETGTRPRSKK
ncbi:MAG: regulatory protein [Rhodocyclales bacterium]|nr:regulatory protein [Rhodocyclales bacterium]